ncbi:hypothetical protein [Halomonas sp. CKK8]|uniref:hypothetical protein n=1 Tax=Halomonas sp. CKK8 TaxID=3036127 RepID=UPI002414D900|nr:hypothetical protein [Halomonas sp. CKK8]WFM71131.1 hypothetical protein P8934_17355 [Halomonas sp. CKK8]
MGDRRRRHLPCLPGWELGALTVDHLGMAILDRRMPGEAVLARLAPPAARGR